VLALESFPATTDEAADLVNRISDVNRVVALAGSRAPLASMSTLPSSISDERLSRLRSADAVVRNLSSDSGFDARIWQFPVVLIPAGVAARPDSVVLRPIDSVDGMTAEAVVMDRTLLDSITERILEIPGICAVFYDLTNKPPATIEWE
jgi:GMP synthase (glutamine-hydrolysing)